MSSPNKVCVKANGRLPAHGRAAPAPDGQSGLLAQWMPRELGLVFGCALQSGLAAAGGSQREVVVRMESKPLVWMSTGSETSGRDAALQALSGRLPHALLQCVLVTDGARPGSARVDPNPCSHLFIKRVSGMHSGFVDDGLQGQERQLMLISDQANSVIQLLEGSIGNLASCTGDSPAAGEWTNEVSTVIVIFAN